MWECFFQPKTARVTVSPVAEHRASCFPVGAEVGYKLRLLQIRYRQGGALNDQIEPQQPVREFTRWMILRMLYACRPGAATATIIARVLQSLEFDCALHDVHEAIGYMELTGLAASQHCRTGRRARLTALGVAVVEFSARAPAGIRRPRRWRSSKR